MNDTEISLPTKVEAYTLVAVTKSKIKTSKPAKKAASPSAVDRVHTELRRMAMTFRFLPGERLNEAILAKELGVSRTPLREALNRLSAEGFLTFSANNGFFRKTIDVKEIFDLYEFRRCLELAAVKLSIERATDEKVREIEAFVTESALDVAGRTVDDFVTLDEHFHEMLIQLTGNQQMLDALKRINERIQFVRWLDMTERRPETQSQHKLIVDALRKRDREEMERLISEHIAHRLDQIVEKVERSYGRIFVRNQRSMQSGESEAV